MESKETFLQLIKNYHETGQTIKAALLLIDEFELNQPNFGGILEKELIQAIFCLRQKEKLENLFLFEYQKIHLSFHWN